jgi:diguanylate cyclase (GGDEF)-like protein
MMRVVLATVLSIARVEGADDHAAMLDRAERIHATDDAGSERLLATVSRALGPSSDPRLVTRVRLLECRWAEDPAAAHRAAAAGLRAAESASAVGLRARLLACRGNVFQVEGKSKESEADYTAALALAVQAKDAATEADARANIGWLQYTRGAMADALLNCQAAYRAYERLGNEKGRLDSLALIAHVYADAQVAQYDRAIEYYRQLLVEYEKRGLASDVGDTLFNIGSTFEVRGDFTAAEQFYRRALAAFQKLQRPDDVFYTRRALGSALMKQDRAREALPHLDAAVAYYEKKRDVGNTAFARQFRGMVYRRLGRFQEALADLAAARQYYEGEKNVRFLERNTHEAALIYEQLRDWPNAYAFRQRHAALQQELATSRRDELASRLRIEFDAEKKEQENRALARENALRATALREAQQNQKLQLAVIVLTALLAIALAVLFWRQVANTRRMRAMAMTDELTRLPNRRHILAAVEIAFAEAKRSGHPAALIVFDIDRFKRINDTYGHAAGDEVLKAVAHACRLNLRPPDQLGRIGGEEFLIVLQPGTSAAQAGDVAERLRASVERMNVNSIAEGLQVTISLGVWVTGEYDTNGAIAAADSLLYRAKESGRNRVEAAAA